MFLNPAPTLTPRAAEALQPPRKSRLPSPRRRQRAHPSRSSRTGQALPSMHLAPIGVQPPGPPGSLQQVHGSCPGPPSIDLRCLLYCCFLTIISNTTVDVFKGKCLHVHMIFREDKFLGGNGIAELDAGGLILSNCTRFWPFPLVKET